MAMRGRKVGCSVSPFHPHMFTRADLQSLLVAWTHCRYGRVMKRQKYHRYLMFVDALPIVQNMGSRLLLCLFCTLGWE
jgi:hypothetical protein